ncbi:MAG: TolC family protein [Vicingaceae bacterium]
MKKLLVILLFALSQPVVAQLSLDSCVRQSIRNFKYDLETKAVEEYGELLAKNAGKSWYPELNLEYRSTFQNQQIEFPSSALTGGPEVPLDFHRLLLNFSQTIYDGSVSAHRKHIENYSTQSKKIELESRMVDLRAQVTKLYMTSLLIEEQSMILESNRKSLSAQVDRIRASAEGGLSLETDLLSMEAELLGLEMKEVELKSQKELFLDQLLVLMGIEGSQDADLTAPIVVLVDAAFDNRPEIRLMQNNIALMESQKKLYGSSRIPKVQLFGSAGAGNPGYNIIDNTVQPMGLIGLGIRWDIWDWNETANSKSVLALKQGNIEFAIERRLIGLESDLNQQRSEISKLDDLMQHDNQMVELRTAVVNIKSSQLENGVITSSDYLMELNKLTRAQIDRKAHELEMVQAKLNYNIIAGN